MNDLAFSSLKKLFAQPSAAESRLNRMFVDSPQSQSGGTPPLNRNSANSDNGGSNWSRYGAELGDRVRTGPFGIMSKVWFLPYQSPTAAGENAGMRAAYREMMRSPYVKSGLLTKVLGVASLDWQVHPCDPDSEADKDAAKFVKHCIKRLPDGLAGTIISTLMPALIDGYSLSEKVWRVEDEGEYAGSIVGRDIKSKDTNLLRLEGDAYNNVKTAWLMRTNERFAIEDFLYLRHLPLYDTATGTSDLRAAYSDYWMLDTVTKLRAIHAEKYTSPFMLGTYATKEDRYPLEQALARARASTWAAIPEGVRVEAQNLAGSGESDYKSFVDDCKKNILIAIIGAYLQTLEGGGQGGDTRGNAQVSKDITMLFQWYLTTIVENGFNRQWIPDLVHFNYIGVGVPILTLGRVTDDELMAKLNLYRGAQSLGLKLSKSKTYADLNIEPPEDDDVLTPPNSGGMGGGGDPLGGLGGGGGGDSGGGPGGFDPSSLFPSDSDTDPSNGGDSTGISSDGGGTFTEWYDLDSFDETAWQPTADGPRGGKRWVNVRTGEIAYGDENPGGGSGGASVTTGGTASQSPSPRVQSAIKSIWNRAKSAAMASLTFIAEHYPTISSTIFDTSEEFARNAIAKSAGDAVSTNLGISPSAAIAIASAAISRVYSGVRGKGGVAGATGTTTGTTPGTTTGTTKNADTFADVDALDTTNPRLVQAVQSLLRTYQQILGGKWKIPTADQIGAGLHTAHANVEQYTDGGDLSVEEFAGNWVQSVAKSGPRKGQTIWRHATTGRIWNGKGNPPEDKPKVDDVHRDVMDVKSDITKATPEKIDELKAKIAKMSRADQDELKKRLGIKASGGTTAEHGAKIAGRALGNEEHTRKLIADARADSDANGADLGRVKALEDHLKTIPPETLTKLAGEMGVRGRAGKDLATKVAMKAVLSDEPLTSAAKTEPVAKSPEPTAKATQNPKPDATEKPPVNDKAGPKSLNELMVTKGEVDDVVNKASVGAIPPNDEQTEALKKYTNANGTYHRQINNVLRGDAEPNAAQQRAIDQIQNYIDSQPALTTPINVFRGMKFKNSGDMSAFLHSVEQAKAKGEPLTLDGFTSTTPNASTARRDFIDPTGKKNVFIQIEATHGAMLPEKVNNQESEFLMNHGSQFDVVHVGDSPIETGKGGSAVLVKLRQKPPVKKPIEPPVKKPEVKPASVESKPAKVESVTDWTAKPPMAGNDQANAISAALAKLKLSPDSITDSNVSQVAAEASKIHGKPLDESDLEKHLDAVSSAWKKANYPPKKAVEQSKPVSKPEPQQKQIPAPVDTSKAVKTTYTPKRVNKANPDSGIVKRDAKGNKVTEIDESNGKRVSEALGDLLPQAYDRQRLFDIHSKQEATLPQMYSWLKERVPGLTMADLHDALSHEWSKGNITLQVHNEVGQLKDPDQAVWRNGLAYNWLNAPRWIGGKRVQS